MLRVFAALLAALVLVVGCSAPRSDDQAPATGDETQPATSASPQLSPPLELPAGGYVLLPDYRLCGYVGSPGAPGQGRLGIGDIEQRMAELAATCAPYAGDRMIMPVMELIAVTVLPNPGEDGSWRRRTDPAIIDAWLEVARRHKALLLLNIQPGQSSFMAEVQALEPYLRLPDVGVALDPEWAMKPGQVPMQNFGSTSGAELDEVATYLAGLVSTHRLPEKVMLYHILHPQIISDEAALQSHPGVVLIKSVDGIGPPASKIHTYQQVSATVPPYVRMGFKLFYEEDVQTGGALMSPEEVLTLAPVPDYVLYE